ncbi:MAG: class I SAM-dependent methyltransferase [Thermoplasmata archaeon]|nr:class I SAM-dependent methyltransferase [Thermoplasmata archaeon]
MGNASTEFWDRTYRADEDFFGASASSLARSSLALALREVPGGSLLELGCGTGRDLVYFAQHGFDVAGCDLSVVAAQVANRRISSLRDEVPPLARVVACDAFDFLARYPTGRTDLVFSNLFLNLESDPFRLVRLFGAVARVLRGGGLHVFSVRSVADPGYGKGRLVGPDAFDPGTGGPPLRFFSEVDLRRHASTGFTLLSLREHPDGGPEFPVVLWSCVAVRDEEPTPSPP